MKTSVSFACLAVLVLAAGCGFFYSVKVKAQVVEHKRSGDYYVLLYEVIEPTNFAGRYGIAATLRSDLVTNVDGGVFEFSLDSDGVGMLTGKPLDYGCSAPSPGRGDFLDSVKRLK
jgi:hypothetical protein